MIERTEQVTQVQQSEQFKEHKLVISFCNEPNTDEYEEIPISDEELFRLAAPIEEYELSALFCEDPHPSDYEEVPISDEELLALAMPTEEELALRAYDEYDIEEERSEEEEFYYNYIPDDYYYNENEDDEFDCLNGLGTYGAWK